MGEVLAVAFGGACALLGMHFGPVIEDRVRKWRVRRSLKRQESGR